MNPVSDVVLNSSKDEINAARRETTELNTEVVELGKVSETRGGIFGDKLDAGAGWEYF